MVRLRLLALALMLTSPVSAQTVASPGAPAAKARPAHHAKAKKHAKAEPATAAPTPVVHNAWDETPDPHALPMPNDHTKMPATTGTAPMSFGMKWNGNNDSSTQTRVQNYNGSADGAGAELGMRLHF